MSREEELQEFERSLIPHVEAAIARGEDLSTPLHMQRFIERLLEENGYALRGEYWVESKN